MAASNPIDTTIFVTSPVPCRPRITTASRNTPKSGASTSSTSARAADVAQCQLTCSCQ